MSRRRKSPIARNQCTLKADGFVAEQIEAWHQTAGGHFVYEHHFGDRHRRRRGDGIIFRGMLRWDREASS